jgi:hypothetical protein
VSRTPKRGKSPGYEYWSPGTPREAMAPGRWSKRQKSRKARREAKAVVETNKAGK